MNQRLAVRLSLSGCVLMFCTSAFAASPITISDTLTVTSKLGKLTGKVNENIATFYAIPYAQDPFIEGRRFQAPQASEAWEGVLDSTLAKPAPPQPGRDQQTELLGAPGDLTLNIWIPTSAINETSKLPVMVWIPGGAFIRGDASESVYDGSSFAGQGVIVVTVNYRVGVDGFMHIEGAPDNRGILDQILALNWVKDNIEAFGGDPKQVTLFGQSAGAESVAILLGTEKANGLFHKAILQSPPMQSLSQNEASRITKVFAEKLEVPATIKGISSIAYPQLVSTVSAMGNTITKRSEWGQLSWGGTAFLPVRDNTLIADTPMNNLLKNVNPSIPVIVGSTDQESRLYLLPSGELDSTQADKIPLFLDDLQLSGAPLERYSQGKNKIAYGEIYAQIQSDYTFRMPALHIAEQLVKNGNSVWHYNFSWQSLAFAGRLGAAHFVDVPFAFNTIYAPDATPFVGRQPPETLAKEIHNHWIAFAKSGKVTWTPYNLQERATMRFDVTSQEVKDPGRELRLLWQDYPF